MINFDFFTPTKILFGAGRESEVGKQVAAFGGHKVMIIYGKKGGHIETSGLLDKLLEENRVDDCKRAVKDPEFCQKLMDEFGIE